LIPNAKKTLTQISLITFVCFSLSACGSIDAGDSNRIFKRSVQVSDSVEVSAEKRGLPSLDLQMAWREQAMASNQSFNPKRRPSRVPPDFRQEPWGRELPLVSPQVEAVLTSDFGWRGLDNRRDFHSGIDIAAPAGTVIYTPIAGQVLYVKHAGTDSGIVISDGERQHTFWHTHPRSDLKRGDWIKAGYAVGHLVNWGRRTHLHYSVHLTGPSQSHRARNDSNAIDPLTLVRRLRQTVVPIDGVEISRLTSETVHRAVLLQAAQGPSVSRVIRIPTKTVGLPMAKGLIPADPSMKRHLSYEVDSILPERR
jgi:hypothetical protein